MHYHWPRIDHDVQLYVRRCDLCQRNKTNRRPPYGLISPHDIPDSRWDTISLDFVGPVQTTSNGFNTIFVVVDSASKRVRIEPCHQTDTARDVAWLFERSVWRNHGLPRKIISDQDKYFTSAFWQYLTASLKIKLNISTSYHPQTDGQTEIKNSWLAQALRHFVNYYQDDWDTYLHIVEHAINDSMNSSTGYTPFYLDTGQHPRSLLDISLTPSDSLSVREMRDVYAVAKHRIFEAQNKQAIYANRHRLEDPFKIGDFVLLSSKHFTPPNAAGRPTRKFRPSFYGPYKIKSKKGISYQLEFPFTWVINDVFHPEKLRPYYWDTSGPSPFDSLPQAERTIEKFIAIRTLNTHRQVLVKWLNHSPVFNLWLPITPDIQAAIDAQKEQSNFPGSDLTILEAGVTENPPVPSSMKASLAKPYGAKFRPRLDRIRTPQSRSRVSTILPINLTAPQD